MRRTVQSGLIVLVWVVFSGICCAGQYAGGDGSAESPWQLERAEHFLSLGKSPGDWQGHFILTADIDMGGKVCTPIGDYVALKSKENRPFTGTFDGNGHEILNLTITDHEHRYVGCFGALGGQAKVVNVRLTGVVVTSTQAEGTGALAGLIEMGQVEQCVVEGGQVWSEQGSAGGLVGTLWNFNKLYRCRAAVDTHSERGAGGGLVGWVYRGRIQECCAGGLIYGETSAGGLVGQGSWQYIKDSYSRSMVQSQVAAGGLIGLAEREGTTLENTYAVSGLAGEKTGGLIGGCESATVCDSYWDRTVSGVEQTNGGGYGRTTDQMKALSTFIGWGCGDIWRLDTGRDYPTLVWEHKSGRNLHRPDQPYGGGSGTVQDPYLIGTAEQLNAIGLHETDWNCSFRLTADIDLRGVEYNPIGHLNRAYSGHFDGNGHTIHNLSLKAPHRSYSGLLGNVTMGMVVEDLTLDRVEIEGAGDYVGALAGHVSVSGSLVVRRCQARRVEIEGRDYCGGLIGKVTKCGPAVLNRCLVTGTVAGGNYVGGVAGQLANGTVSECGALGEVSGYGNNVGGLAGQIGYPSKVEDCYARVATAGQQRVGGLIGHCWDLHYPVDISRCYAASVVEGLLETGGLVGKMTRPDRAVNCYWDRTLSGQSGSAAGTGIDTQGMHKHGMYQDWNFESEGDGPGIWTMYDGNGYPRFKWQVVRGELVWPEGVETNDLGQLARFWLAGQGGGVRTMGSGDVEGQNAADLDGSQIVDMNDFGVISRAWKYND